MLHSGDGVLGVVVGISLPPNTANRGQIFFSILVSSDHITFSQASSGSSRCSLANFRWACTCAFFSRGTLRAQQDFNPSWCSVTDGSLHDCGPNCLQVINTLLLCCTGLILDLSHHHWYPTRRDLAWSPRPREIGSDFMFLIIAATVANISPCCLLIFL